MSSPPHLIGSNQRAIIVIYSADLLKLMGTNIARDLISNNHECNEQKLWRHVILNAMEDARINNVDRKSSLTKIDAHDWIAASKDFEQICWWAGWDPEELRIRYKKALQNNEITFNLIQLRWKEYYDLYLKHKEEKDKEVRAQLRATLIETRMNVGKTRSVLVSTIFLTVNV
tara:strand:+ start:496 stop:1011 length:516 start_codon:yes stop_codon:yes gene_type:complete